MKKLAFIGAGRMAEALIKGVLSSKIFSAGEIIASDIDAFRLDHLRQKYKIEATTDNKQAAAEASTVLLAVKPQHIDGVLEEFRNLDIEKTLFISIAAGVTTKHILEVLGRAVKLVRVMPNAPALVGKGVSAIALPADLTNAERRIVVELFGAVGKVVFLDENLINQATALSGSGPAYFFYIVNALIEAGVKIGLSEKVAAKLVKATISGSAKMLEATEIDPVSLIEMVASKGGTTEAALKTFDQGGISDIIIQGVSAALERAAELDAER